VRQLVVRTKLREALRTDGILDRRYRVYRASHTALYSNFRVEIRALQISDPIHCHDVRIPLPNI
jgi:hypothetical protein